MACQTSSFVCVLVLSSLTTRKAGNPVKFFGSSRSLVTDFEYGQLRLASQLAKQHEITMTMYYAPWDLESRLLKRDFQLVAEHFYGQINFVAINCWWPDGECSKQLSIKRFPVLSAFLERWGDVEYRGPLVASYIIPFLDNLLNPVTTINNEGDLIELRSKHDVSVFNTLFYGLNTCFLNCRLWLWVILISTSRSAPMGMTASCLQLLDHLHLTHGERFNTVLLHRGRWHSNYTSIRFLLSHSIFGIQLAAS